VRSAANNPFNPGFGDADVWVERPEQLAVIRSMVERAVAGAKQAPRLIEQERGYGKTTLLAAVEDYVHDWAPGAVVVRVAAVDGEPFTTLFVSRLVSALRDASTAAELVGAVTDALSRIKQVRLAGVLDVALDGSGVDQPASIALVDALERLGEAARADGDRPVVLLLDEAHVIDPQSLRAVFTALQEVINRPDGSGRVLPFAVLLAGLPGLRSRFKQHKVTFGERCRDLELDRLEDEAIRAALLRFEQFNEQGVRFAPDAIERLIEECDGHPHVFQLIGEGAWDATSDTDVITVADVEAGLSSSRRERSRIAAARISGLTEAQMNWLAAAAELDDDERTLTAICRGYRGNPKATAADCGSLGSALLAAGVVRPSADGRRILFALRGMREHLRS
jgi:type II secretory pathway predicted ATPase ExeA